MSNTDRYTTGEPSDRYNTEPKISRKRSPEREEFLGDIICTALEGGIGYWSAALQYQYSYDGDISVYCGKRQGDKARATIQELSEDGESFDGPVYEITLDAIASGIGKILRGEIGVNQRIKSNIYLANSENDAGYIDADDADVIVQAAVLGELRYG